MLCLRCCVKPPGPVQQDEQPSEQDLRPSDPAAGSRETRDSRETRGSGETRGSRETRGSANSKLVQVRPTSRATWRDTLRESVLGPLRDDAMGDKLHDENSLPGVALFRQRSLREEEEEDLRSPSRKGSGAEQGPPGEEASASVTPVTPVKLMGRRLRKKDGEWEFYAAPACSKAMRCGWLAASRR